MPTLYIVATPIGNLEDLTARAVRILSTVATVACEDTRVTRKLYAHLGVPHPRFIALKSHASEAAIGAVVRALSEGEVALVSDAGTPGIADPGSEVVNAVRRQLPDAAIVPVPGPSSVAAALSVSGFPADRYYFAGFPPHKKGRNTFFTSIVAQHETVVLFESPHRIEKTLAAIAERAPDRPLFLARELTKRFETTALSPAASHLERILGNAHEGKGEFVLILAPIKK